MSQTPTADRIAHMSGDTLSHNVFAKVSGFASFLYMTFLPREKFGEDVEPAGFLDVKLGNDEVVSAKQPRGFPRVIGLETLDPVVFSRDVMDGELFDAEEHAYAHLGDISCRKIGINTIDAVATVLYRFRPTALEQLLFHPEVSLYFGNITPKRSLSIGHHLDELLVSLPTPYLVNLGRLATLTV